MQSYTNCRSRCELYDKIELMIMMSWIAILFMGLVLGLLGAGGAILTIPILVYLINIPGQDAVVYSYAIVGALSIMAAIPGLLRREVDVPAIIWLGIPSVVVLSWCRSVLMPMIPKELFTTPVFSLSRDTATMLLFAIVVAWSATRMLAPVTNEKELSKTSKPRLLITGVILGLLTGLLGVGGGFIIIPALVIVMGLGINIAVNTSLTIISINTLFGLGASYALLASLDWFLAARIIAVAAIGMVVGIRSRQNIPASHLKRIFAWMLLAVAVFILLKEIMGLM